MEKLHSGGKKKGSNSRISFRNEPPPPMPHVSYLLFFFVALSSKSTENRLIRELAENTPPPSATAGEREDKKTKDIMEVMERKFQQVHKIKGKGNENDMLA